MTNKEMHTAKPMTNIAYLPRRSLAFECKNPRCRGWTGAYATWDKKNRTLTVECTLCETKLEASRNGLKKIPAGGL